MFKNRRLSQFRFAFAAGVILALTATQTAAFEAYDNNKDGKLDVKEQAAARLGLKALPGREANLLLVVLRDKMETPEAANGLSVAELKKLAPIDLACFSQKRFVLRKKIVGQGLHFCPEKTQKAQFSLSYDHETNTSKADVDFGFGIRLGPMRETLGKTALSTIAFVEGDGTLVTSGPDTGTLRFGFETRGVQSINGGSLDWSIAPYVLTDLDFDARAQGLQFSLTPQFNRARFNTRLDGQRFFWTGSLALDYLNVEEAGTTGFTSGTEYTWLSANLGFRYDGKATKALPKGYAIVANSSYAEDLQSGDDLSAYNVTLSIPVAGTGGTSLLLKHERGRTRSNPNLIDKTTFGLGFAF